VPPVDAEVVDVLLLAVGAIVGALAFSLTVGRHRAARLARLTDRLALLTSHRSPSETFAYPDRTLSEALERLAGRIADVEALASTDTLTRLLNRQAFVEVLSTEIARANRHGRSLGIALIDIDHFKRVNDSHGHAVGDALLRHLAELLRTNVRATDLIGRYGGEEFIVAMPETDLDGALASAEHLRRTVAASSLDHPTGPIRLTISIGVTGGSGASTLELDRLLRQADVALYNAKALGRDQVNPYRPADDDAPVGRATIAPEARARAQVLGRAAFDASNRRLMRALATRSGWAGGASDLISTLAGGLAGGMGLPPGDIERIRTASLLHDLGKLAIPDEILSKPAALTPHEWRTIVEHPKIGQVVLEQAGAIRDAAAIVLHHHEWFDGRGYPYGLAGAEIPLGSRIVAIADAYEAMISDRPYKRAMSHADALAELRRQAGTQFDPTLVSMFVDLYAKGVERDSLAALRGRRIAHEG
jgi:diguanylate cyclase (GGDEF)-like protein